jgi:hypothetical protein
MYQNKHSLLILGALMCLVVLGQFLTGVEAKASFSFTYTASDTVRSSTVGDAVQFPSLIVNTGQADSFVVAWTESNPPTPQDWWARYCCDGLCFDSTVHTRTIYLAASDTDWVYLDVIGRSQGQGKWVISVQSKGNSITKTKTFILSAWPEMPVINEWGLIILILLISTTAMYILYRKLNPVKQT